MRLGFLGQNNRHERRFLGPNMYVGRNEIWNPMVPNIRPNGRFLGLANDLRVQK
jgi:hypothetical protein